MPQSPNILFVFTDQQSLRAMSCAGNPYVNTPNMDALAREGVRFERSYCTSPVCTPSRASLVTGKMPHEVGVAYNDQSLPAETPSMGGIFRDAGYHTLWTGKWHVPAIFPREVDEILGFEYRPLPAGWETQLGEQTDAYATDQACEFLTGESKELDRPWLLSVSLHNPHDICWWVRYAPIPHPNIERCPPLPANFEPGDEPEFLRTCRTREHYCPVLPHTKDWDTNQWRAYLYTYYLFTEMVDLQIGRIRRALEESGQAENTLVVFTSDHGEGLAGHRVVCKLWPFEEICTVPMILKFPGRIPAGATDTKHLVSGIDILPTLCDYAGIAAPEMTGMSMRTWIDSPAQSGRDYVVVELAPDPKAPGCLARIVRSRRHKYIVFTQGDRREMLFDLESDPGETKDIAQDAGSESVLTEHRDMLRDWTVRTHDPFPVA